MYKKYFFESDTVLIIWYYYDHAAFLKICSLYNHIFKMLNFLSFLALVLKEGVFALTTSSYASLLGVEQNFSLNSNLTIFKLISTLFFFFPQYNYIGYLDYKKETIRKLAMKANTCSFNPGVFVANLTEWKLQNITKQLEKWMALNVA